MEHSESMASYVVYFTEVGMQCSALHEHSMKVWSGGEAIAQLKSPALRRRTCYQD